MGSKARIGDFFKKTYTNSKISYRRYILTCVTGTIPSILSSIFLGKLISYVLIENIPIWVLIVAIVLVMGLLLLIGGIVISRVYFNEERYTPNSLYYLLLFKVFNFIVKKKVKVTYDDISLDNIEQIYKARPSKDVLDGLGVLFCCFQRETPKCAVCPLHRLCAAVAYSQSNFFGRFSALHYHGMGDAHP